jgi:hypothetical protein
MWKNMTYLAKEQRKLTCFGGNNFDRTYLKQRNKQFCSKLALVTDKNNNTIEVLNIAEFCRNNDLNYGNFKTMLRGKGNLKSCQGYTGHYVN